jgi:hypothetical protein
VWGLRFRLWVYSVGFWASGTGAWVQGFAFWFWVRCLGLRFRVEARVWNLG